MQMNKNEWTIPLERENLRKTMQCVINPAMAAGKEFVVEIRKLQKSKTYKQCKGWHRILGLIADHLNEHKFEDKFWNKEHVKHYIKGAIQYGEYRLDTFIPRSFAAASKEEAMNIIEFTQLWAVESLNMDAEQVELESDEARMLEEYYADELRKH